TYPISQPVVFEPQDGGTKDSPVTYAGDGKVVISGGREISGWRDAGDGLWVAEIPEVKDGKWYFQDLWINGRRATRARTPNARYFHATRPALEAPEGAPPMGKPEFTAFYAEANDLAPLSPLNAGELKDAEVVVFQTWQIARHRVAYLKPEAGYVQFTAGSRWPFLVYETRQRYFLENFKAALDAPGEWFLDRSGQLFYKPLPDEDMTKAKTVAPVADQLLAVQGNSARSEFVSNLHFKGIAFQHSRFELGKDGHIDSQADSKVPAVVMLDGASDVTFENCEIAHTGIYAIWFRKGCTDCRITGSYLHDMGAGGVRIGDVPLDPDPLGRTHGITVHNNIIHTGGRYFMGSVGVFITHSGENTITHNDIGDFFYSGVSAGWVWGYAESVAHHNKIEFNHIHHLGYGVLSDMGAVYLLGPASGTTVSNNHAHHVNGYRYGGWGLYTDEGSSGVLMENNLVHHTRHAGFHQHYGKDNIIRNNIFAFGEEAQIQRSRTEEHLSFSYQNNIVYFDSGLLLYGQWTKPKVRMEQNLYWNASKRLIDFGGEDFVAWQKQGYDRGSKIADPLFVDVAKGDFHLKPESPALAMGFKPFDYSQAGVTGDAAWKQLAASLKPLELEREELPVFTLGDDFEGTPVGKTMWNGRVSSDPKGGTILASDEQAKSGKRSLKFQDAPGLPQRYQPHLSLDLNHKKGATTVSFNLWLEPESEFTHEWRDKGTPYQAGPSLEVRKGSLKAAGKELLKLEPGKWYGFEVKSALGDSSSGKWQLVVTLADGTRMEFKDLPFKNAGMKALESMVFVSDANVATAFYLDDLRIHNE
ncbi:MAG: right-handed parallel beta-helix repeat-containing protein, partial [Verrucomicrobium sp.]